MQGLVGERNSSIDILKAISIFGVLVIHTIGGGLNYLSIGSFGWYSAVFWGTLIRFSVPVFFMCSGALLLNPDKEISLKKLYFKNLPRIVIALFFWAIAYEIYDIYEATKFTGYFDLTLIIESAKNLVLFRHHFHFYYLHIIILVYVFLPLTRIIIRSASKAELQYILVIWFILGIVYPRLRLYYPFNLLSGIPVQYSINMTYSAIGYGLAGHYLVKYKPRKWIPGTLLYFIGFAITFVGTLYLSLRSGKNISLWEGMSPGVGLMAIGLFSLVVSKCQTINSPKWIKELSLSSFCIYLIHDFFNQIFRDHNIIINRFSPIISIPLISLLVLITSYIIYKIISKIPVLNKYLI